MGDATVSRRAAADFMSILDDPKRLNPTHGTKGIVCTQQVRRLKAPTISSKGRGGTQGSTWNADDTVGYGVELSRSRMGAKRLKKTGRPLKG